MIRIIDDEGNQLAIPIDMENPEIAAMIMDTLKIDIIMRELREKSVEDVVTKLLEVKVSDRSDLMHIVSKLFDEAAISLEQQSKFGELAKKLIHVLPSLMSRNRIDNVRLKPRDMIAMKIEKELTTLVNNQEPTMHFGVDRDYGITMFIAHLYNIDLVPDDRLFLWLLQLSDRQRHQKYIRLLMKKIKPGVLKKMAEPGVGNRSASKLYKFLKENGVIEEKKRFMEIEGEEDGKKNGSSSDTLKKDDRSSSSEYESASESAEASTSKSPKTKKKSEALDDEPSRSSKGTEKKPKSSKNDEENKSEEEKSEDIVKLFEDHLENLKSKQHSNFDIQLFKACSDEEKRQCSKKLLAAALDNPDEAKIYSEIVLSILQLSIPAKASKKNFNVFLKEACDEEMKKLSKQIQDGKVDYSFMESFGTFLAELFVVEGLKVSVFNKWLEETKNLAIKSDDALQILFKVFKIFQNSMKKRDFNSYKNLIRYMKDFREKNRILKEYVEWFDKLLSEKGVDTPVPTKAETSSAVAIKKAPSNPIISASQTINKFHEFLAALVEDEDTDYQNYMITDTSTEALQGCASIFLEYCIVEPETASVFCKQLISSILPALEREHRVKFRKFMKYYIIMEMSTCVRLDKCESSNWDRCGKITCGLCELYKTSIIEMDLIDYWFDRLNESTKSNIPESNREFQAGMLLIVTVMGRMEAEAESSMKLCEELFKPVDGEVEEEEDTSGILVEGYGSDEKKSKYFGVMIKNIETKILTTELVKFAEIILNIQKYTMDNVARIFKKIEFNTEKDFENFLNFFHGLCLRCQYPSASASIAKFLSQELRPFEFRERISKLICSDFRENIATYKNRRDDDDNKIDTIILLAAEFYNYGITSSQTYMASLEKLATNMKTTTQIHALHISLFTTALKLIHTGDGNDLQQVHQYFQTRPKYAMKKELLRRYAQFLEHFTVVFELSAAKFKESQKKSSFQFILDNLNENNFENSVKFVDRLDVFKNNTNSGIFIKKCLSDMKRLDILAKFVVEVARVKIDFKDFVRGCLVVEFGNVVNFSIKNKEGDLDVKRLREIDIPKVQRLLDILIALYNVKFCNIAFVDLFLQFLSQDACQNRLKCSGYLLKILGARMKRERPSMIEESFVRIKQGMRKEKCKILFERVEKLCQNGFKFECEEDENSFMLAMGADWKNEDEKEEVIEKNKKKEVKGSQGAKNKIEKENLEGARPEKAGQNEINSEKLSNLSKGGGESYQLNQKGASSSESGGSSSQLDQERSQSSNLDQGGVSSPNFDKEASSSSHLDQRGASSSNLDQRGASSLYRNQRLSNSSRISQREPSSSNLDQSEPSSSKFNQKLSGTSNKIPQDSSKPTPSTPEDKPLTAQQIQENFAFFTRTESDFEIFLKSLQNQSTNMITICQNMAQKVTRSDESQKEFLQNIWKYCLIDDSLVVPSSEMCKMLSEKSQLQNFSKNLEKFIQNRINSLLKIVKASDVKENEAVRKRIASAFLLIAALYSQDLISDNIFESCATTKLTSLLNCQEVADLLVIISGKINEDCDENIQLQAKVLGLENLQRMRFSEVFMNIKDDLMVIKGN